MTDVILRRNMNGPAVMKAVILLLTIQTAVFSSLSEERSLNYQDDNVVSRVVDKFERISDFNETIAAKTIDVIREFEPEKLIKIYKERSIIEKINGVENGRIADKCAVQLSAYVDALSKFELWSLKMLDSSSKIPSGILTGNMKDLGQYDECMSIDEFQLKTGSIRGRHCMYSLMLTASNHRVAEQLSICIPSACGPEDLKELLQNATAKIAEKIPINILVRSVQCSSVEPAPYEAGEIVTIAIFSVFICFLICCTFYDIFVRETAAKINDATKRIRDFSFYTNLLRIFNTTPPKGSIACIQGIRFFSLCWVILGHEYVIMLIGALVNIADVAEWRRSWSSVYIFIAPYAVDTFFILSGFLTAYIFLKEISKGRSFNPILYYLHRYIRLTPAMAALILMSIYILPRWGSGAQWQLIMSYHSKECKENWWPMVLYVHNYVNTDHMFCLPHTWYLAVDMQFFWISPLILYPLAIKPKYGLVLLILLIVGSIISPAVIIAEKKYPAMTSEAMMNTQLAGGIMKDFYMATHARAGPWLLGVLLGYILSKKQQMHLRVMIMGWISSIVAFAFIFFTYRVYQGEDYEWNAPWEFQLKTGSIRGRHCMYSLMLTASNHRVAEQLSICIPSACGPEDLKELLQNATAKIAEKIPINILVRSVQCSSVEPAPYEAGEIVTIAIFSVFICFLICCTFYDIFVRETAAKINDATKRIRDFSFYTNLLRIFNTTPPKGSIACIQGIRFFSLCWVILGHEYVIMLIGALVNIADVAEWRRSWSSVYIFIAPYAVDTFFILSGFLTAYIFLKEISKGRSFNPILYYLHRYIRLTPAMAALILMSIYILPRWGSGAQWQLIMSYHSKECKENWWPMVLYVHNYVNTDHMFCLPHTWYLAVDMQFFWISPLILYPLAIKPKYGLVLLILLIVGSIISPAVIIAEKKYPAMTSEAMMNTQLAGGIMKDFYMATHARAGPWLLGVLLGYILSKKQQMHLRVMIMGWISSIVAFAFIFFTYRVYQGEDYEWNAPWEVFYAAVSKHIWAFAICWLIYSSVLGYGGIVGRILSWSIYLPFARISYSVYLVHFIIQIMRKSADRTFTYFTDGNVIYSFFAELIVSCIVGLALCLVFESPFVALEKMIFKKPNRSEVQQNDNGHQGISNEAYVEENGDANGKVESELA